MHDKNTISTIINYCTNEYPFISHSIKQALKFSEKVIVPVCTSFFSGEPENKDLLLQTYNENPLATFIEFDYEKSFENKKVSPHFWINMSRWIGTQYINSDYIFYLDADEILDAKKFNKWREKNNISSYDSITFESYWYFRDASYRAHTTEYAGTLIKRTKIKPSIIFSDSDRHAMNIGNHLSKIKCNHNTPMMHHLSWVRTKEQMIRKVKSWGHKNDRTWEPLIEKEFENEFSGVDFVHGYKFETVDPIATIDLNPKINKTKNLTSTKNNVIKLSRQNFLKLAKYRNRFYRYFKKISYL